MGDKKTKFWASYTHKDKNTMELMEAYQIMKEPPESTCGTQDWEAMWLSLGTMSGILRRIAVSAPTSAEIERLVFHARVALEIHILLLRRVGLEEVADSCQESLDELRPDVGQRNILKRVGGVEESREYEIEDVDAEDSEQFNKAAEKQRLKEEDQHHRPFQNWIVDGGGWVEF